MRMVGMYLSGSCQNAEELLQKIQGYAFNTYYSSLTSSEVIAF